jgi:organic hydroperoxide reductase OsmC/OhrA
LAEYTAEIIWQRKDPGFTDNRYSRAHAWVFDGGVEVPASSSPHVVPIPYSNPAAVDPEEAFVAALSSCHMLWFLALAARRGYTVDRYVDRAVGVMAKNAEGRLAMTRVTLRPRAIFAGTRAPSSEELHELHEHAHLQCFIANSVKTIVECRPESGDEAAHDGAAA